MRLGFYAPSGITRGAARLEQHHFMLLNHNLSRLL